jgi:hypothetical protein
VPDKRERIDAYEASITRLTKANADLRAEQGRMKWVALATVLLSNKLTIKSARQSIASLKRPA